MFGKLSNKLAGAVGGGLKSQQEKNAELVQSQIIKPWKLN